MRSLLRKIVILVHHGVDIYEPEGGGGGVDFLYPVAISDRYVALKKIHHMFN